MILKSFIVVLLVLIDQGIKIFVQNNYTTDIVVNDFLTITYAKNYGASFSILEGNNIFIMAVTILAIVLIFILLNYYKDNKFFVYPLLVMLAGTIGNLIDRLYLGYVVDYISVNDFPIFNLADMCLTLGAAFLIGVMIKEEVDKWKK